MQVYCDFDACYCAHWTRLRGLHDWIKQLEDASGVYIISACHALNFMIRENRLLEMRHADR